jgi:hypothetical protein
MSRILGVRITGPGRVPAGTRLEFEADLSLYEVAESALLYTPSKQLRVPLAAAPSNTNPSVVAVVLPDDVVFAAGCEVIVGTARLGRYPYDSVRAVRLTKVEAQDKTSKALQTFTAGARVPRSPWGVEVGCQWQEMHWGPVYRTFLPSVVSIHSTGPASVNRPLTVRVALDAALKADLRKVTVLEPKGVTASRMKEVDRGWEFTLTGSLKAGTGAFVALDFEVPTLPGELPDIAHPRVEVFAPQHDPAQRSTRTETATRLDSVVNAAMARDAGLLN